MGTMDNVVMANPNMVIIFEIGTSFINYSSKRTNDDIVKHGQKILKIGTPTNFRSRNSNMSLVFEVDVIFINYS